MNKNLIFFIILLIIILMLINNQTIQEHFRPWKHDIYNRNKKIINQKLVLPAGDWKDTCQIVDYRPPLLWAECKDFKGIYRITSKNLSNCISKNLSNIDGELQCDN